MPDELEAYSEVEIRELNGDKATVETKDGRVSSPSNHWFSVFYCVSIGINQFGTDQCDGTDRCLQ